MVGCPNALAASSACRVTDRWSSPHFSVVAEFCISRWTVETACPAPSQPVWPAYWIDTPNRSSFSASRAAQDAWDIYREELGLLPPDLVLPLRDEYDRSDVARVLRLASFGLNAGRVVKALPLPWMIESTGGWPQGLLDVHIAMIPQADRDSTPFGQRRLSVLAVVHRLWASLRLGHLKDWVQGWVPKSVFSLGNGVSSVGAWFSTALDIEKVLAQIGSDQLHVMVADVIKSFDTVDGSILDCALGRLVCLLGLGRSTSLIIVRFVSGLSWPRAWRSRGVGMAASHRGVL